MRLPPDLIEARVAAVEWAAVTAALDEAGWATVPDLLSAAECREIVALYADERAFRRRIVMQRHAYGSGEYQYFRYPLPPPIGALRRGVYPHLVPLANRWCERLRQAQRFPPALDAYLALCHAAGQTRPTPLVLKYEAGDYNRLHQDLYGPLVFPLQLTILLSDPQAEFAGGEFLLVEGRPRTQSRGEVVPLDRGEAVIFPVHHRPAAGARGFHRATMRHGVSRVRAGRRYTLGIIFHDAA
jgi:uncharacterized protein